MKRAGLSVLLLSILLSPTYSMADKGKEKMLEESRVIVQEFAKTLKGELKAAMKEGGPANGIQVCNEKAIELTSEASKKSEITLSRTSLKIRNKDNAAQPWEKEILEQFEARKSKGESPKKMEYSEIVDIDGKKQFRYMKAIGIAQPCLNCHGEKIIPDVQEKLSSLYPDDMARGYKLGDIRGAFVLVEDLD